MPSHVYAVGKLVAVENTFVVDFDLPHEFYTQHVKRVCDETHLHGISPCVLWLCSGYDNYWPMLDQAESNGWALKLALAPEFDKWLSLYMRCVANITKE